MQPIAMYLVRRETLLSLEVPYNISIIVSR